MLFHVHKYAFKYIVCFKLFSYISGVIYTSDAVPLTITSLLGIITESCDTLVGKPKLFFIQACQGSKSVSRTTCENIQSKNENQSKYLYKNALFIYLYESDCCFAIIVH